MLLHYPRLWITKIYYLFYWVLLSNIFFTIIVFIFPVKPNNIDDFWSIEIAIFCIEVLCLIIWLVRQSLYNIEKQYGNTRIIKSWVEITTYMICIFLIFSTSMVFPFTFKYAMLREVSEIDLAIDIVVFAFLFNDEVKKDIQDIILTDTDRALKKIELSRENPLVIYKKYLETKEFEERKKRIEQDKISNSFKFPDHELSSIQHQYLEKALDSKTLVLLSIIQPEALIDLEKIINKENKSEEIIENSILSTFYKLIEKEEYQKIINTINKYTSLDNGITYDEYNDTYEDIYEQDPNYASYAISQIIKSLNLEEINHLYHWNDPEKLVTFGNYELNSLFIFHLIFIHFAAILFLFKHIYFKDFLVSFIILIATICVLIIFSSSLFISGRIFHGFMILLAIFLIAQLISVDRVEKRSLFKTINLISLLITIVIITFVILINLGEDKLNDWWFIASFAYFPFVPLIKRGLLKLLSVPKE